MQPNIKPLVTDGAIERANHLVLESLKAGPRNASEILAAGEGAKISLRTIQRAAIGIGVAKTKAGFNRGWVWRLPADDGNTAKTPSEQPAFGMLKNVNVSARVETTEAVKDRKISNPLRTVIIAARLRRLEEIRGKKAPIYAQDSRVMRWAELGILDSDIREAYERAVTALEDARSPAFVSVGFLDPFVMRVISEGDKA
jgi:hypothetical protein